MFTFRSELNRYNSETAPALYGADLGGYLTAVVVIFCLLSVVPLVVALVTTYKGVWRVAVRNAAGPIVAIAARVAIAHDPSWTDAGLIVLLLAIVVGLVTIVTTLVDVSTAVER